MSLDCDFLIIGSGPAGSVLSWNLANKGFKIVLVDRANNLKKSDRNSFIFSPYIQKSPNCYTPLFSNQLGGNSALWNNKVYLISEDEFKSGNWGFNYDELQNYSIELAKKFEINHNDISNITLKDQLKYSQSKRVKKLGNIFDFLKIKENQNIDILSNSSPVKLNIVRKEVISAEILTLNTKEKKIVKIKKDLIFCAGGLGNPTIIKNLLGNGNKKIGQNLCDHSHINLTEIKKKEYKNFSFFSKYFINTDEKDIEQNLYHQHVKDFVGVNFDFLPDPARILKRIFIRSRNTFSKFFLDRTIKYYSFFYKVILSILSFLKIKGKYSLEFFFSQKKNPQNNVMLSEYAEDIFGLKKSNINWKIDENEKKIYNDLINDLVGKNGKIFKREQKFKFDEKKIFVGLHPSCTTAIGNNSKEGCVDDNLKLFDYDNVYVSGSSVFNINGFTNPTWTIMTLSYRLSEYLKKNTIKELTKHSY